MNIRFEPESVRRRAELLPPLHRVAFAASCCERLLPNYEAFSSEMRWGSPGILRSGLDYVWRVLERKQVDHSEVQRLVQLCEKIIPDTEEFSSAYTSAALDAGTAVVETLRLLIDSTPQRLVDIATFSRDTVDMFIQQRDHLDFNTDPAFENKICRDPLMVRELTRQDRVLKQLSDQPTLDRFFIKRLRDDAYNHGVSNIDVVVP